MAAARMGKRTLLSDEPREYKDLHFHEVLIALDGDDELPMHPQVQVRIKLGGREAIT